MWLGYFLAAFAGGVVSILALLVVFLYQIRRTDTVSLHFGGDFATPKEYEGIELLEQELRVGGLYVRFRNNGDDEPTSMHFRIRAYDDEERLIAAADEFLGCRIAPGQTGEEILVSHDIQEKLSRFIGRYTMKAELRCAWIEAVK